MNNAEDVYESLVDAKNLLRNGDGWCQNMAVKYDSQGVISAYCITGVLHRIHSLRYMTNHGGSYNDTRNAIATAVDMPEYAISTWNDKPGRTYEEVAEAFDKAIKLVKLQIGIEQ